MVNGKIDDGRRKSECAMYFLTRGLTTQMYQERAVYEFEYTEDLEGRVTSGSIDISSNTINIVVLKYIIMLTFLISL